jgi:hypothetical protein
MSDSPVPPEHVILYKKGKKVTTRRSKGDCITFRATLRNGNGKSALLSVKNFLRYVITETKELNLLKNDVLFLVNELYGLDHSIDENVALEKGHVIYVYCHLPYKYTSEVPADLCETIFPHDLMYIRRNLTATEVRTIKDILKKDVDIQVYCRRPFEKVAMPVTIRSI